MLDLSNSVEIICVDGRSNISELTLSAKALLYSTRNIKFKDIKFISPYCPLWFSGTYISIPTLSLSEYNVFMLKKLHNLIEAEHALFVQWDGFVLRPDLWNNNFLAHDFIGAPWPPEWPNRAGRIGNGGFSLRSKRLMSFISSLEYNSEVPEDNFICLENKDTIELNGFKFAPVEIAARFSWENPIPEIEVGKSFGFHGRHLKFHKDSIDLLNTI